MLLFPAIISGTDAKMPFVAASRSSVIKFKVTNPSATAAPFYYGTCANSELWSEYDNSGSAGMAWYGSNTNGGTLSGSSWNVVVATYNGSTVTVYLNGTQVSSGSVTLNTVLSGLCGMGYIAGVPLNNPGLVIDYLAVWGRVLTSTEISELN